jgi:hypothetical protein
MSGGPGQLRRFLRRLAALFRAGRADDELGRELDAHLRLLEDQYVSRGMSREEARYAARRAFGGVEQAKALHREERSFRWLAGWPMDLKLGRTWGVALTAAICAFVVIVSLVSCTVPLRRALRVDPITALRTDA